MVRLSGTNLLIKSVPRKRIGQKKLKKIFWRDLRVGDGRAEGFDQRKSAAPSARDTTRSWGAATPHHRQSSGRGNGRICRKMYRNCENVKKIVTFAQDILIGKNLC